MDGLLGVLTPHDPDFQNTVAAAFQPGERRAAYEIPNRGTDGSGWIGGKVFEKKTITDGCCTFKLSVEKAYRAQISFSANLLKYVHALPLAMGAEVRVATRGLELEDIKPSPLMLQTKFVWHEGLVIHVKSKAGEEAFVDTFAARSPAEVMSVLPRSSTVDPRSASPSTVPTKRKRTSPSSDQQPLVSSIIIEPRLEISSVQSNVNALVLLPTDDLLVNPSEGQAIDDQKQVNSVSDSHNPQSLPSPPPEGGTVGIMEVQTAGHLRDSPFGEASGSCGAAAPTIAKERSEIVPQQEYHHPRPSMRPPGGKAEKKKKKEEEEQGRDPQTDPYEPPVEGRSTKQLRLKQQRKAMKIQRKHAAQITELNPDSRARSADVDEEDELWAAVEEDIPNELLNEDAWLQDNPMPGPGDAITAASTTEVERSSRNEDPEQEREHAEIVTRVVKEEAEDPVVYFRVGFSTPFGKYIPLTEVHDKYRGNVMGVVTSPPEEKMTATGEHMASFILSDPTNIATKGLSVTLFSKTERAFPDPEIGDILLLRSIVGDSYGVVGASFRSWSWAVFHVKTGKVSTASVNTPRHLKAGTVELQRSLRLGDWWRDVASSATSFGVEPASLISAKRVRAHKLISEVEPMEYFDCTVEVLHGLQNNNSVHDVYMLFVTDYTRHEGMPSAHGQWCPPKLAEVALPVELWETANACGPSMRPGEFYSLRNIKLKCGGGGHLEGKMVEGQKITKLDEDQLEGEPQLVELLKRKKEWEAKTNAVGGGHEWPHQLMEEAERDRHFNCTVEVVHVSPRDNFLYLYVTDYTPRPDLVMVSPTIVTSTASADRIVRISLHDSQIETARNLEVGDFISIRKLRLRQTGGESHVCGRLGGDERLIMKLNPNSTKNAELRALLRRKKEVEAGQSKAKPGKARAKRQRRAGTTERRTTSSETSPTGKGKAVAKSRQFDSLADVKASDTCPGVFRVQARVVDFFPDDLRDCTVQRCTSCNETIPKTRRMCTRCDDAMEDESFARVFYQLYFRIADEDGTTLDVSISDIRCSVLKDLDPEDVYEDDGAFDLLVARVRPLLGDLLEVSDGEARRRPVSQDAGSSGGPLLDLRLGSWMPEGEPDEAESRAYIILTHSVRDVDA